MEAPTKAFYENCNAHRINTDAVIIQAIRSEYAGQNITTIPQFTCDLLQYAAAGQATAIPVDDFKDQDSVTLKWRMYFPPVRRLDGDTGGFADELFYAKYLYTWQGREFVMYLVSGRDGQMAYPMVINQYVIGKEATINELIMSAGHFTSTVT